MKFNTFFAIAICLLFIASVSATDNIVVGDDDATVNRPSFCPTVHSKLECMLAGQVCIWAHGKCISNPYSSIQKPTKEDIETIFDGLWLGTDNKDVAEMLGNNQWGCQYLKTAAKCAIGTFAGHCLWWDGKCHTL